MEKIFETVQRVESHYVGDDCIQVSIPYKNIIDIINKDGIIYSHKADTTFSNNKYLEDERRHQFPYSNIPMYCSGTKLFGMFGEKMSHTNQLFNFNEPYIIVKDEFIFESFVVKDKSEALIVNSLFTGNKKSIYVNRKELEEIFSTSSNNNDKQDKYILQLSAEDRNFGELYPLASEEQIYNSIKNKMIEDVNKFRKYADIEPSSSLGSYLRNNPLFLDYVEQSTKNLDLSNMNFDVEVPGASAIIVKSVENDMTMQLMKAMFIGLNKYRIDIVDIPMNKYTLEQLKNIPTKIYRTKEPKIPLRLNPNISRQDIKEAKQMVKSLRK